jgi:hypothetical protein
MDEYFEYFSKKMGSSVHRRAVPQSSCERYKDKLPPLLISHWNNYGWSGYGEGLFWTVNPAEYEPVINAWLEDSSINQSPPFHVIARGAFGDLYLWQEGTGSRLTLCAAYARYLLKKIEPRHEEFDTSVQSFFASKRPENNDFDGLFSPALHKLGPLQPDEMYGFVPALALGGPGTLNTLQKVKTIEHLTFLSQLSPLTDWGFPEIEDL